MVEAMIERHADDRYVLIVHLGEVREAKPSRLMHLPEDHFLLGTMDRPPWSDPSLQCAPNAPIKLRVTATYLLENCHCPQTRTSLAPDRKAGVEGTRG